MQRRRLISGLCSLGVGATAIGQVDGDTARVLATGSGRIRLSQTAPGDVDVATGSGSIKLTGVAGALEAHAGSGGISGGNAAVGVHTDGSLSIDGSTITISTSSTAPSSARTALSALT